MGLALLEKKVVLFPIPHSVGGALGPLCRNPARCLVFQAILRFCSLPYRFWANLKGFGSRLLFVCITWKQMMASQCVLGFICDVKNLCRNEVFLCEQDSMHNFHYCGLETHTCQNCKHVHYIAHRNVLTAISVFPSVSTLPLKALAAFHMFLVSRVKSNTPPNLKVQLLRLPYRLAKHQWQQNSIDIRCLQFFPTAKSIMT